MTPLRDRNGERRDRGVAMAMAATIVSVPNDVLSAP